MFSLEYLRLNGWLYWSFNTTLTAKVISWQSAYVFPGFLTPVLTLLFFPKPQTTFLTCFCKGKRQKYAGKKSRINPVSKLFGCFQCHYSYFDVSSSTMFLTHYPTTDFRIFQIERVCR